MATYGYIRVSTAEQAEGSSLEDQKRRIGGLALAIDLTLDLCFDDVGVSGSIPLVNRPSGSRLCAALDTGDSIIVAKLDRLFRSAADALAMAETLKKQGVNLYILDMGTEPVTANGASRMFFGMLALVAEFERTRIKERLEGPAGEGGQGRPYRRHSAVWLSGRGCRQGGRPGAGARRTGGAGDDQESTRRGSKPPPDCRSHSRTS